MALRAHVPLRSRNHRPHAGTGEDDLGWQDIRQKFIRVYCDDSKIQTVKGREQCEKVCTNNFCCYATAMDGYDCRYDESMTCEVDSACRLILSSMLDNAEGAEPGDTLPRVTSPQHNDDPVLSNIVGVELSPVDFRGASPPPLGDHFNRGDVSSDPMGLFDYGANDIGFSLEDLREMKSVADQQCSDYHTSAGRLQCEITCQSNFHPCCYIESSLDGSCRENPMKLCYVYDVCKVLTRSSNSQWSVDNEEQKRDSSKMNLISTNIEQKMRVDLGTVKEYLARTSDYKLIRAYKYDSPRQDNSLDPFEKCVGLLHQSDENDNGTLQNNEYQNFIADLSGGGCIAANYIAMPFIFKVNFVYLSCRCKYHPIYKGDGGDGCCLGPDAGIYITGASPREVRTQELESFLKMVCRVAQETIDSEECGLTPTVTVSPLVFSSSRPPATPDTNNPTQQPTMRPISYILTKRPVAKLRTESPSMELPQPMISSPSSGLTGPHVQPVTDSPAEAPITTSPTFLLHPSVLSGTDDPQRNPSNFIDSSVPSFAPSTSTANEDPNGGQGGEGDTGDIPPVPISTAWLLAAIIFAIVFAFYALYSCYYLFFKEIDDIDDNEMEDILNEDTNDVRAQQDNNEMDDAETQSTRKPGPVPL